MNDFEKYYQVLGLAAGASDKDVKSAYRDLVKVWHPDRFAHDPALQMKAQEKLKQINDAYEQLKRRSIYFGRKQSASSQSQANASRQNDNLKPTTFDDVPHEESRALGKKKGIVIILGLAIAVLGVNHFYSSRVKAFQVSSYEVIDVSGKRYHVQGHRNLLGTQEDQEIISALLKMKTNQTTKGPLRYKGFTIKENR